MTVLDASAVLDRLHNEIGADVVRELLVAAGVTIEPLTDADAEPAGAMRARPGGRHGPTRVPRSRTRPRRSRRRSAPAVR